MTEDFLFLPGRRGPLPVAANDERAPGPSAALTREKIARAAVGVFLARGIDAATTKEIARAAGISEGAIYRHFPSKEDLAWALFETHHERLTRLVEEAVRGGSDLGEQVARVVTVYAWMADRDWPTFAYHLLNQHRFLPRWGSERANPVDSIKGAILAGMADGKIEASDAEVLTASLLGIVLQPAIHKAYQRWDGDLGQHAPRQIDQICRALNIRPPTTFEPVETAI